MFFTACDHGTQTGDRKEKGLSYRESEKMEAYIAIDLETTGLDPKRDRMIEIGAVRVERGRVVEQFSSLVNPQRTLEPRITALTGITDEMLASAPELSEVLSEVLAFCGEWPLLGHHVIFDYSFLKRAAVNAGQSFARSGVDTLKLARRFMPEQEKKNLSAACAFFGVGQKEAHRAVSDAISSHQLYQKLLEQYGKEEPELFEPKPLIYNVKKEQPASKKQKEGLRELLKYHRISLSVQLDSLSRNEVSRITDQIILKYGRMMKR